jgi:hypothetical protein
VPDPLGFVGIVLCLNYRHMVPLPVRDMVRRYSELYPVEMALLHLRCDRCRESKLEARLIPLCEASCRWWRSRA